MNTSSWIKILRIIFIDPYLHAIHNKIKEPKTQYNKSIECILDQIRCEQSELIESLQFQLINLFFRLQDAALFTFMESNKVGVLV